MELEHIALRSGRLSSFLKGELNMSTGLMNRLKWTGALLVNGQPARTNTQVTPGDRITALLDDPEPEYPAEDMPLEIRYEDRDLLVVDKPAGTLIHPSRHRMTGLWPTACWGTTAEPASPARFTRLPGWTGIPSAWCCWPRIPTSTGSSMTFTPRGICIKSTTAWCTARRRGRRAP